MSKKIIHLMLIKWSMYCAYVWHQIISFSFDESIESYLKGSFNIIFDLNLYAFIKSLKILLRGFFRRNYYVCYKRKLSFMNTAFFLILFVFVSSFFFFVRNERTLFSYINEFFYVCLIIIKQSSSNYKSIIITEQIVVFLDVKNYKIV